MTGEIIKAFYTVYHALGHGFLEICVHPCSSVSPSLRRGGLDVVAQAGIDVYYGGAQVGQYNADLLVNDQVLVELVAARTLLPEHEAQLLNYLKATPYEVGLLLNFGPQPEIVRKVYDNERKGSMTWLRPDR